MLKRVNQWQHALRARGQAGLVATRGRCYTGGGERRIHHLNLGASVVLRALKRAFVRRWLLPPTLRYLRKRPALVSELIVSESLLSQAVLEDLLGQADMRERMVNGLLSERPSAQQVAARVETLARHVEGHPELEARFARAAAYLSDARAPFRSVLREALYENPAWALGLLKSPQFLEKLIAAHSEKDWERVATWAAIHRFVQGIMPWLAEGVDPAALEQSMCAEAQHEHDLRRVFYEAMCAGDELPLRRAPMRLPDTHSFWPQLFEVLIREDYRFEAGTDTPRIIDAGVHLGLATYYFKSLYPSARIVAFEPSPALFAVAEENLLRRCLFTDVALHPFALHHTEGEVSFHLDSMDTMAGGIGEAEGCETVAVRAVRLSGYLGEPVDYLKLDIEGAEGGVLRECAGLLHRVHHVFIEYHERHAPEKNSLPEILRILDEAGFDYEVGKSFGFQQRTEHAPMTHLPQPYSAVIWAKNRVWPPVEQG